jgi:hypothetical protein
LRQKEEHLGIETVEHAVRVEMTCAEEGSRGQLCTASATGSNVAEERPTCGSPAYSGRVPLYRHFEYTVLHTWRSCVWPINKAGRDRYNNIIRYMGMPNNCAYRVVSEVRSVFVPCLMWSPCQPGAPQTLPHCCCCNITCVWCHVCIGLVQNDIQTMEESYIAHHCWWTDGNNIFWASSTSAQCTEQH